MSKELPIPPVGERCRELVRVWAGDGSVHVSLSPDVWDDPGPWGILLADLARHLANAYAARGVAEEKTLARIKSAFDAEWSTPTDVPRQTPEH